MENFNLKKYLHENKLNEDYKENISNGFEKVFKTLGFNVTPEGVLTPTTQFSKIIINLAVKQGYLIKNKDGNYILS
jgi:hypothetical protein